MIAPPATRKAVAWAVLVGMLLVTALLYSRVRDYPFLQWDDPVYVTTRSELQRISIGESSAISDLLSPKLAWRGTFWEYFPLRDLSYAFDAWRGNLSARAFHQTNVVLHLVGVALVSLLAWQLTRIVSIALFAGALFALHPVSVEPVAWVSGRKDLLLTVFALGVLIAFQRYFETKQNSHRRLFLILGCLSMIAAALSKGPGVITLPLALMLAYAFHSNSRPFSSRRFRIAIISVSMSFAAWLWFSLTIGKRTGVIVASQYDFFSSIFHALGAPVRSARHLLFPLVLSPSHGHDIRATWFNADSWIALLLVLLSVLLWKRRRFPSRTVLGVALLFCLSVLPTSGIVPVSQEFADRFHYLPLVFFAIGLSWVLHRYRGGFVALGLLMLLYLYQTHTYLDAWKSDLDLWRYVIKQDPENPVANGSLGAMALEQGEFKLAKPLLDTAVKHAPNAAVSWTNLGLWWQLQWQAKQGDSAIAKAQAEHHFKRAIELDPRRALAYNGLGELALDRGNLALAELYFREGTALTRGWKPAALNLLSLLKNQGRTMELKQVVEELTRRFPVEESTLKPWIGVY